jgi:murein endopeptidase
MQFRTLILLLLSFVLTACGDRPRAHRANVTEFSDTGPLSPNGKDLNGTDSAPSEPRFETPEPTPEQTQRQLEIDERLHKEDQAQAVTIYQTPVEIRERLRDQRPDLVVESGQGFTVEKPFLNISSQSSTMTFTAILSVKNKPPENIELKCTFDKAKSPWSCNDMYPVDPNVARQRRLQATVSCADNFRWALDSYPCEDVGIELYVVVNGKTETQLFQTRKFGVRVATSGDEEVEDHRTNLKELPEPIPAGPRTQEKAADKPSEMQPIDPISAERPKRQTPEAKPGPNFEPAPEGQTTFGPEPEAEQPRAEEPKLRPKPRPEPEPEPAPVEQTKPTPEPLTSEEENPIIFAPVPDEAENLSDDELKEVIDDPNVALEFTAPIPQPRPDNGPKSIPGVEQLRPEIGDSVADQAQGSHNNGRLLRPAQLPDDGAGYVCRDHGNKDYGANIMIDLIKGAAQRAKRESKPPIVIATIAKQGGGCVTTASGRCHSSHRNGLDVDIVFPSKERKRDMWAACEAVEQTRKVRRMGHMQDRRGTFCRVGGSISSQFDTERFWAMSQAFVCARGAPVIAMFLDPEIKKHMCNYAKNNGGIGDSSSCAYKTLRAMKDEPGHYNHVHIRLRCPGNRGSRGQDSIVTLGDGTGC